MRLLLDSHTLVWWLMDEPRLSRRARVAIADPDNDVWASAVTGYELMNKQRLGKLDPPIALELIPMIRRAALPVLSISLDHAVAAGALPGPHGDPWDRLLMAQCQLERFTAVTKDPVFTEYGIAALW